MILLIFNLWKKNEKNSKFWCFFVFLFNLMQLWNSDHGHVIEACKDSLKKLQLDYLDLYLVHFPVATRHTGNFLLPLPQVEREPILLYLRPPSPYVACRCWNHRQCFGRWWSIGHRYYHLSWNYMAWHGKACFYGSRPQHWDQVYMNEAIYIFDLFIYLLNTMYMDSNSHNNIFLTTHFCLQ